MTKKVLSLKFCLVLTSVLTVLCIAFIFQNSLKDSVESSQQSSFVKDILDSILSFFGFDGDIDIASLRTFAHFAEFFMLGICLSSLSLAFSMRKIDLTTARISLALCSSTAAGVVIAIIDELLQLLSDGRVCDIKDVLIDSYGLLLGTLIVLFFFQIHKFIRAKRNKKIA
jgi:VanZ family protein